MILIKKIIRKLYHLIWFLSIFLLFTPFVYATDGEINGSIFSSDISATAQAQWYDVNHNEITTSITSNIYVSPYFSASGRYNSYLSFNINTNLQSNVLYSLTVYIGGNGNPNLVTWNNAVATSTWNGGVNSNNQNNTCRAYVNSFNSSYNIKYNINMSDNPPTSTTTGAYYITFTPSCNGSYINIPVAFESAPSYMYLYGYHLEPLGLTDGLTSQQVQSIVNNSGLATANSVSQVQQSINQTRQDIINSSGSIIDNQNATTGSIIDNQNANTDKEIESQKVCRKKTLTYNDISIQNKYLATTGVLVDSSTTGVSDYINISSSSTLTITKTENVTSCFYDNTKTKISCFQTNTLGDVSIPSNASYIRITFAKNQDKPNLDLVTCQNGNQGLSDDINNLNDTLNDDNVDSSDDTINSLKQDLPTNTVISDLMLLPVRLLQAIVNSLGGTCSTFNLGSLYGTNLIMPCIDIEHYLGSSIWTFVDLVFSGMFILVIRKKFIQIFHNITNLRGGSNEVD